VVKNGMNFNLEKYKKAIKAIGEPPRDDDPERDSKWLEWYDAYHAETTWFLEGLEKELREKLKDVSGWTDNDGNS